MNRIEKKVWAIADDLIGAAQLQYDFWEQPCPEIGYGGICERIADDFVCGLMEAGLEACQWGDQDPPHAYALAWQGEESPIVVVDIDWRHYEVMKGFASYKKIKGVVFDRSHLSVYTNPYITWETLNQEIWT